MNLERFVKWTREYWHNAVQHEHMKDSDWRVTHALMGLVTEAAEVVDLHKKMWFTPQRQNKDYLDAMEDELGDVLHYWARCVDECGLDPTEIMTRNVDKIEARYG